MRYIFAVYLVKIHSAVLYLLNGQGGELFNPGDLEGQGHPYSIGFFAPMTWEKYLVWIWWKFIQQFITYRVDKAVTCLTPVTLKSSSRSPIFNKVLGPYEIHTWCEFGENLFSGSFTYCADKVVNCLTLVTLKVKVTHIHLLSGQGVTTDLEGQLTLKVKVMVTHIQ